LIRRYKPDFALIALLFVLPLILFWQQTVGGRTLLPTENLFQYEPFATYREVAKAPEVPHNALLSDLVLENFQWKSFIRESISKGDVPLWNPHQFSGIPFMAAGQQSTLYPFSILYYVLPLPAAYGWFTVVQLWLAGAFMYLFMRGMGVGRFGGVLAGVVYQLSAFFVISAVFPMIIAAAVWLPLVLLAVELVIQQRVGFRGRPSTIPWVVLGAVALGCNVLAGHVEITYYVLIIAGYYAAARLLFAWWAGRRTQTNGWKWVVQRGVWLLGMVVLGIGLGAIQFIPLFELASMNYRDGRASLSDVLGWAHPTRDVVQFLLPNFYGNPSHHSYVDIFSGQTVTQFTNAAGQPINTIDWGIKNYVEGALYLGILPLVLAVYGLFNTGNNHRDTEDTERKKKPPYKGIFAVLTVVALTFMFGLPTYAILYYGFPGINQLHSPFRWIFGVTVGVAVLAGFGADTLTSVAKSVRVTCIFGYAGIASGVIVLVSLLLSRVFFGQVEPLIQSIVDNMALANVAFSDARMFYSYQFTNVLALGLALLGTGVVFLWAGNLTPQPPLRVQRGGAKSIPIWQVLAVGLVAGDLMAASWTFNPASDPALLDFTPPAIQWLQAQEGDWRYTTIDDPTLGERGKIMNANMGWRYDLDDIRGYESIIPKQYVDFMSQLAPQVQLDYNRVAPLYTSEQYAGMGFDFKLEDALNSPLLKELNVRYVMTSKQFEMPSALMTSDDSQVRWTLAYEDEAVRIWEHAYRPRVIREDIAHSPDLGFQWPQDIEIPIESDSGREKILNMDTAWVNLENPQWQSTVIISETYLRGWRAFARPRGGEESTERPLTVVKVLENFVGVDVSPEVVQKAFADIHDTLPDDLRTALDNGQLTLRISYNPESFQIGLFASFISGVLLVFMAGVYLWRLFVSAGGQTEGVQVVARNSVAPIILNLFNRGIDFGFAFIMLRILGPEGSGIYTYAGFIFGWFDIFTNFGLNVFLTREVARDPSKAWRYFYNTSGLRLVLMAIGVVLLIGFLNARQSLEGAGSSPLSEEALIAIGLLYIGLLPNSLSTGMSALFYAFQQAEYPAAISTIATICKVIFGVTALVLGYGVIGLAAASIITNTITLAVMVWVGRGLLKDQSNLTQRHEGTEAQRNSYRPDGKLIRGMIGEGWPLMLNHFLATIFFQIDVVIIQYFHGDKVVGEYGVAYKWVAALNVIPAFFTMALLPMMSRQAHEDKAGLKRNYGLAIKLLVSVALPLAVVFTALAFILTGILGGSEYLPDGAIATQLMIWSIPIGWINSLTQYVLIALDLQRRITRAFFIAVSFNLMSNLVLIPMYSYRAAAVTTILSELMLLIPFGILLHGAVGRINWVRLLWKPVVATAVMIGVVVAGSGYSEILAVAAGGVVYIGVLLALRPLDAEELERLAPLLPGRIRSLTQRGRAAKAQ